MTRALLGLLARIDRGDFSAVAPAIQQLVAERHDVAADALRRVSIVAPRGRGAA